MWCRLMRSKCDVQQSREWRASVLNACCTARVGQTSRKMLLTRGMKWCPLNIGDHHSIPACVVGFCKNSLSVWPTCRSLGKITEGAWVSLFQSKPSEFQAHTHTCTLSFTLPCYESLYHSNIKERDGRQSRCSFLGRLWGEKKFGPVWNTWLHWWPAE